MVITKSAAKAAAQKMADQLFDEQVEALVNRERALGDRIAEKYYPADVLKVVKTYPEYVGYRTYFYVSRAGCDSLEIHTTTQLPLRMYNITVSSAEYKEVSDIITEIGILKSKKYSTRVKLMNEIVSMRTYKRLEKEAPNLLEYFPNKDEGTEEKTNPVIVSLKEVANSLKNSKSKKSSV